MLRGLEANDRLHVEIPPVAKARMIAECERRSREEHRTYSLTELVIRWAFALPALAPEIERALEEAAREKPRRKPPGAVTGSRTRPATA